MSQFHQSGVIAFGRCRGIPIYLRASFFVAAAILTFPLWQSGRASNLALAAIAAATLFGAILLHELAHAFVARRYGLRADWIDIDLYGGVVHLSGRPRTLARDLAISIAGPVSNLLAGALAFGLLWLLQQAGAASVGGLAPLPAAPDLFERALRVAAYINIGLGIVNILPAVPLDGGRIAYLLIERRFNSRVAMRVVGALGLCCATLSTAVFLATLLAGFPIWAPPEFRANWRAFQDAGSRSVGWNAFAA